MPGHPDADPERLAATVPDHVVHRVFAEQTVILNLHTGRYHGLNATAAAMVDALDEAPSLAAAVERLAPRWNVAPEVLLGDLMDLCAELERRGLLETHVVD